MAAIIGTAVKGNEAGSAVSEPVNITDVINSFQSDGAANVITWENIAKWIGARAAADVANVKLATLENGVVPGSQLPLTGFEFKGDYNPATNSPALANSDTGKTNWVYRIVGSANPTARDFGAGSINCSDDEYLAYSGDSGAGAWVNIGQGATKQISEGGTGATTKAGARTNLELLSEDEVNDRQLSKAPENGVVFDGSTTELDTAHDAALDVGTGDCALSVIMRFPSNPSANERFFDTIGAGSVGISARIDSSGRFVTRLADSGGGTSSTSDGASLAGREVHLVVNFDRSADMTRFVNAVQYGTADDISSHNLTITNSNGLDIGHNNGINNFEGVIRSLVYWNKVLSTAEIEELAENGNQPSPTQLASDVIASYQGRNVQSDGHWLDESSNEINATGTSATPLRTEPQRSGAFTPSLSFSTTTGTITYSSQEGEWLKLAEGAYLIGINLVVNTISGHSGNMQIEGLPFAAKSGTLSQPITCNMFDQVTPGAGVEAQIIPGNTYIQLFEANAASTRVSDADVQAGTRLRLQGILRTA